MTGYTSHGLFHLLDLLTVGRRFIGDLPQVRDISAGRLGGPPQ
jgi:hypothetical protein